MTFGHSTHDFCQVLLSYLAHDSATYRILCFMTYELFCVLVKGNGKRCLYLLYIEKPFVGMQHRD
mgnify:CR=1 FL=1